MDIKRLFKKSVLPTNSGDPMGESTNSADYIDKYYLVFPDLPEAPTYPFEDTAIIGSSNGNIIIEDESISLKHCTLTLNQDVISILDHSSQGGTFINKKRIQPGRFFILQDKDSIKLGDLELKLSKIATPVQSHSMPISDIEDNSEDDISPPELPADATVVMRKEHLELEQAEVVEEEILELEENLEEEEKEDKEQKNAVKASGGLKLRDLSEENVSFKRGVKSSANSLVRVLALIIEVLIVAIILSFIGEDPVLKEVFADIYTSLGSVLNPIYDEHLKLVVAQVFIDVPALKVMLGELNEYLIQREGFYIGLGLLAVIRVLTPLLLGVSVGQFLLGVRSTGNVFVVRALGFIRELIGLLTLPLFFIFDLMTLVSKRSFKEILSFTQLESAGVVKTTISLVVFLPLIISLYLITPMIQGLDFKSQVSEKKINIDSKKLEGEALSFQSSYFSLEADFSNYIIFENFQIKRVKKKRNLTPFLDFYSKESKRSFRFVKEKSFSFQKLIASALKDNFLAEKNLPYAFAASNDVANLNKSFKRKSFGSKAFVSDIKKLTSISFSLTFDNLIDHIEAHGPFLNGFVNYRANLEKLIKEDIVSFSISKVGNINLLILKTISGFKFFPINKPDTNIYSVNIKNIKDFVALLNTVEFKRVLVADIKSDFNELVAMDFILNGKRINDSFFDLYFGFLKKKTRNILTSENPMLIKMMDKNLNSILKAIRLIKAKNSESFEQNLNLLLKALKEKDLAFFEEDININKEVLEQTQVEDNE